MTKNKNNLTALTQCSVMLALSIILSLVPVWKMPMGGEVTLLSMLPVILISIKYGAKYGLRTAFAFSLFNLFKGIAGGEVFSFCATGFAAVICVLFDYIFPFTALGLSGIFRKKNFFFIISGIVLVLFIRFCCHFFTGLVIWSQFAPEGQSKFIYSLLYNGQYMLPEGIFTVLGAALLIKIPAIKNLILKK